MKKKRALDDRELIVIMKRLLRRNKNARRVKCPGCKFEWAAVIGEYSLGKARWPERYSDAEIYGVFGCLRCGTIIPNNLRHIKTGKRLKL